MRKVEVWITSPTRGKFKAGAWTQERWEADKSFQRRIDKMTDEMGKRLREPKAVITVKDVG